MCEGISFGIVTQLGCDYRDNPGVVHMLWAISDMFEDAVERYPNLEIEIIVCGGPYIPRKLIESLNEKIKIIHIPFDETIKTGWITKKKNIIAQKANHENLVIVHDYYLFEDLWLKGFLRYNELSPNWEILSNTILTYEGTRHSDWLVNQKYMDELISENPGIAEKLMRVAPGENGPRWVCGLPYDCDKLSHIQYISGGQIIAKKKVLLDCPLDENLVWGQAEDLAWSEYVIKKGYGFKFNPFSVSLLQKPGKWRLFEMPHDVYEILLKKYKKENTNKDTIIWQTN